MARAAYSAEHTFLKTSPINYVAGITAPVLYCGAKQDSLCPMHVIELAAGLTTNSELYAVDCNHFELFSPQHMPGLLRKQLQFLLKHVNLPQPKQEADEPVVIDTPQETEAEIAMS
eukprot:GHRR01036751.1.p1 GENE.GHRR01036751.1~~GHRR01036751.1.p1  ORF type:complete len:116 (+),score=36.19 GHRR01036751.1:331-678(+)